MTWRRSAMLQFGPGEGLVGAVIADPRAFIVPNVDEDPRYVRDTT